MRSDNRKRAQYRVIIPGVNIMPIICALFYYFLFFENIGFGVVI